MEKNEFEPLREVEDGPDADQKVELKFEERPKISKKWKIIIAVAIIVVIVIILAIVLALVLRKKEGEQEKQGKQEKIVPGPTEFIVPPLPTGAPAGADGPYTHGVVAADAAPCSVVGRDILKKNGSAVDSAIAALFCIGIINMHSAGIGGGGFMTVYNRSLGLAKVYDFREVAPGNASANMYVNSSLSSKLGASATGVPGEVSGYLAAWKAHGRLPWKDLVQPAIDLAKNGFRFGHAAHYAASRNSTLAAIKKDPGLSELLLDSKGNLKELGAVLEMPKLGRTLERIRDDPRSFYTGELAQDIVKDIRDGGGIITLEDLKNYQTVVRTPLTVKMDNYTLYTNPPPGSGAVLSLIMNIVKGYNMTAADRKDINSTVLTYHRIVEAFKFAYAYRALLGDEDFWDVGEIVQNMTSSAFGESLRQKIYDNRTFDYKHYGDFYSSVNPAGTTHLSLISPDGDAVSATTTVNLYFGSKYRSTRTGIIYNNEMDDFSTPGEINYFGVEPSRSNFIEPGKRPMSSMTPTIIVDHNNVTRLALGASGGTKITTAIPLVVMNYFWFNQTLTKAVEEPRFHHQLLPNFLRIERVRPISLAVQEGLKELGHNITEFSSAVVQAAATSPDGKLYGKADPRKGSWAAGF